MLAHLVFCLIGFGLFVAALIALVENRCIAKRLLLSAAGVLMFSALPFIPGMSFWGLIFSFLLIALAIGAMAWIDKSTDVLPKSRPRRWSLLIILAGFVLLILGVKVYSGDAALTLITQGWLARLGGLMAVIMGLDLIGYGIWMVRLTDLKKTQEIKILPYALLAAVTALSLAILWAWAVVSLIALMVLVLAALVVLILMLRQRSLADLPLIGMVSLASLGKGTVGLAMALHIFPLAVLGAFFAVAGLALIMKERLRRGLTWAQLINP